MHPNRLRHIALAALVALAIAVGATSFASAAAPSSAAPPTYLTDQAAACKADLEAATKAGDAHLIAWSQDCVKVAQLALDAWVAANPTPTSSPTASASPTPSPTPSATPSASPTPSPSPSSSTPSPSPSTTTPGPRACPPFPAMPDASCTGVPPGVTLRSCSIPYNTIVTDGAVYDGCYFNGQITVQADNVTIRNSRIAYGRVNAGYGDQTGLTLIDVEIDGMSSDPNGQSAIGDDNYTCIRCNVHATGRGAAVGSNVVIRDSWFHDFFKTPGAHMSGVGSNGGAHNQIVHNTIDCQETACSGALVMYGDFDPVDDVLVQNNLFASPGSYCTYAGSTGTASGKPYPHGTNIRYLDNRWSTKYGPNCGMYGPVAAWEWNAGNVWTGNAYTTGVLIRV